MGQSPLSWIDPKGEEKDDPWPGVNKKKEIQCGPYLIVCETDPIKGRHCHWGSNQEKGRGKTGGKPNCVRPDGTSCEGSAPPPRRVMECLRQEGLCKFEEQPIPYAPLPNPSPIMPPPLPLPPGGGIYDRPPFPSSGGGGGEFEIEIEIVFN